MNGVLAICKVVFVIASYSALLPSYAIMINMELRRCCFHRLHRRHRRTHHRHCRRHHHRRRRRRCPRRPRRRL